MEAKELCKRENLKYKQDADIATLKGDTLRKFEKVPKTPSHLLGYCSELMDNVNKALKEAQNITKEYLEKKGCNSSESFLRNNIKLLNRSFSQISSSKMNQKSVEESENLIRGFCSEEKREFTSTKQLEFLYSHLQETIALVNNQLSPDDESKRLSIGRKHRAHTFEKATPLMDSTQKTKGEQEKHRHRKSHETMEVDQFTDKRERKPNTIGNRDSQMTEELQFNPSNKYHTRQRSANIEYDKRYETEFDDMHSQ